MSKENYLEAHIQIAKNRHEYSSIISLRNSVYEKIYPKIPSLWADQYDFGKEATLFYSQDGQGHIKSTSRLVEDDINGLPSEKYVKNVIQPYRKKGMRIAEFGKFVNTAAPSGLIVKSHHQALYETAQAKNIDIIIIVTSLKRQSLYAKRVGAEILSKDIQEDFGSNQIFAAYAWSLKDTRSGFFRWIERQTS